MTQGASSTGSPGTVAVSPWGPCTPRSRRRPRGSNKRSVGPCCETCCPGAPPAFLDSGRPHRTSSRGTDSAGHPPRSCRGRARHHGAHSARPGARPGHSCHGRRQDPRRGSARGPAFRPGRAPRWTGGQAASSAGTARPRVSAGPSPSAAGFPPRSAWLMASPSLVTGG